MNNELGITYNYYDIQHMLLGAIEKTPCYFTNDAIKLDGYSDLETLYNEIIEKLIWKKIEKIKIIVYS